MKSETEKQTFSFPEEELDDRERVWYFGDYAAGLCLYYLEGFMAHAQIPGQLRPTFEKAASALRLMLESEEEEWSLDTYFQVLLGLHDWAVCLPAMNAAFMEVDDEAFAQANVKVACRILPALKDFAGCAQHPPRYFARVYPDWGEQCLQWDETLRQMIEAFSYLRDFNQKYDREGLGKAQVGLHLFAEYLQEMYNL